MIDLNEIVDISKVSLFRTIDREGFIFTAITEPANVYDAIVIKYPSDIPCFSPRIDASLHSLEEQIDFVNKHSIEKALIIAENIEFITMCPTLKYLRIIPPDNIGDGFDYSPLYKMRQIKSLSCSTIYGFREELSTTIDCLKIKGLEDISISNSNYINFEKVQTLKKLSVSDYKDSDIVRMFDSLILESINIIQSNIYSLNGIEKAKNIQDIACQYIRNLRDISSLVKISASLKTLVIENCPKIEDFSCLFELTELEHLELYGKNKLPNLSFLTKMRKLKTFSFSMEIEDGNLTPCLRIPYVYCKKGKKHYNLKDKDLPKNINLDEDRGRLA